ncbi:MAG: TauD/TfdA family dioxygenase [Xanthobacteraceae bacterium]
MDYESIRVTPVTPRIGAHVDGIALAKPLTNRQVDELHQALAEHQVLFFRDQPIDVDAHKRFGRYFGELHIHPSIPGPQGHPEILPIHTDANSKRINGEYWHSDVSCDEEPPAASVLYLHILPTCGGDTLFASQYAAYEALSPRMKTYLDGLVAVHSGDHVYRPNNAMMGIKETGKAYPQASHPVVRTHPVTKRKALYVNSTFTTHIEGLPRDEGRALLDFLCEFSTREEFQVRFRWEPHSIAFWDNRCVQHLAMWDYYPQTRIGRRVTITGDRPY